MRRVLPLLLIALLAACQSATTTPEMNAAPEPSATQPADTPSPDAPTVTHTAQPTETALPTALPVFEPPLPSANTFRGMLPEGAKAMLGIGAQMEANVSPDQSLIAVNTFLGIMMLDAVTMEEVWSVIINSLGVRVHWSPDSSKIAVIQLDRLVIYDAHTGEVNRSLKRGEVFDLDDSPHAGFSPLAWSPNSTSLVFGDYDGIVWDIVTNQITHLPFDSSNEADRFIDWIWLPDGRRVAGGVGSVDNPDYSAVWDTTTGAEIFRVGGFTGWWLLSGLENNWSPDFTRFATVEEQYQIWDGNTGQLLWTLDNESLPYYDSHISPDWLKYAVEGDGKIEIFEMKPDADTPLVTLVAAGIPTDDLSWSPNSALIASVGEGRVWIWNAETGDMICDTGIPSLPTEEDTDQPFTNISWLQDGSAFVTRMRGETIEGLWDTRACERTDIIPIRLLRQVQRLGDGDRLFIAGGFQVMLWDKPSGQVVRHLVGSAPSPLGWTPDSQYVGSWYGEEAFILWNIDTMQPMFGSRDVLVETEISEITPYDPARRSVESPYAPIGIRWREEDDFLEAYHTETDETIRKLEAKAVGISYTFITWSADGRRAASSEWGDLYIWDTQTWQLLFENHDFLYEDLIEFSPDGKWLAAGTNTAIVVFPVP